ncbi:MAG: DMT family transporter [Cytophagales bacterium]|nr:DMT family transporter [Cytophagales bacterium]
MGNLSFVSATFILGVLMLMPFFLMDIMSSSQSLKFTTSSMLQFVYIGVGPSVISYYLWNKSIVEIGSTKAATIYNTLPVFSAFFAALILNEQVLAVQIVSSAIIVAGVFSIAWQEKQVSTIKKAPPLVP